MSNKNKSILPWRKSIRITTPLFCETSSELTARDQLSPRNYSAQSNPINGQLCVPQIVNSFGNGEYISKQITSAPKQDQRRNQMGITWVGRSPEWEKLSDTLVESPASWLFFRQVCEAINMQNGNSSNKKTYINSMLGIGYDL